MTNEYKGKEYYEQKQDWGKAPIVQGCLKYFPRAIKAVAEVSAYGFTKYKSWGGWRDVEDGYNRYTDALGRHLVDGQTEERNANDAFLLHDAQAAWNALARLELKLTEIEATTKTSGGGVGEFTGLVSFPAETIPPGVKRNVGQ